MKHNNQDHETSQSKRSFRVLIVDDNVGSAKILGILFSRIGPHIVELAHCGEDAVNKAKECLPDLVILDICLGDRSGIDVVRELRQHPEFEQTFFVALTGNSSPEDREATRAAGFDLHLTKPVGIEEMEALIARL